MGRRGWANRSQVLFDDGLGIASQEFSLLTVGGRTSPCRSWMSSNVATHRKMHEWYPKRTTAGKFDKAMILGSSTNTIFGWPQADLSPEEMFF
jgi:hypothetical protein